MMKYFKASVALLMFLLILPPHTSAHPISSPCFGGSELYGYIVDCNNHQASNSFTYNHLSSLDSTYAGYFSTGASRWSNTGVVSITRSFTTNLNLGYLHTFADPNTSTVATFYAWISNSAGHLTGWKIGFNTSVMNGRTASANQTTAAHELGHAIGINDLNSSANISKLMYGYSDRTATSPTSTDITGAIEATRH